MEQTPLAPEDHVTLTGADVGVASDYTKKRNVLRLTTDIGSQFLLQAESEAAMSAWLSSIKSVRTQACDGSKTPVQTTPTSSAPDLTVSPCTPHADMLASPVDGIHSDGELAGKHFAKKVASPRRTRSPSHQWPVPKSRKPQAVGDAESSPKSKTWKGRIGKHLKKMQASTTLSPSSVLPHGASIGVCLEDCPPSIENEMVPLIVAVCIGVIESKGSQVQGIYRIPGNRAAVTHLTEMVNQGPDAIDMFDPRWSDINVIASLLKHFFQKLPEPLISSHLYTNFIEASKMEDAQQRLIELKHLVHELPDCHYETLRFLINHFKNIVSNSEQNKMDVKNLAIVFGPTLIRALDDNVARLVTDMTHQCRIVESLITHASWFFSDSESMPTISDGIGSQTEQNTVSEMETSSQSLLLNNVNKVEAGNYKETKKFVSSLISAANRIHKNRVKKSDETSTPVDEPPFLPDPIPMSKRRISNMSVGSINSTTSLASTINKLSTSSRDGHYFPPELVLPPKEEPIHTDPACLGDEVAIRSYAGLSARTQERIRQFELETRAMMLQRDIMSRQESQKLESGRKKVEDQLQKAKKDLETEDIFDRLAKNPSEIVPRMNDYFSECVDGRCKREGGFLRPNASPDDTKTNLYASSLTQSIAESPTNTTKDEKYKLRDTPDVSLNQHNEGSDLLRDITQTFEEKMKSLQDPIFLNPDEPLEYSPILYPPSDPSALNKENNLSVSNGKLYRDPSLHRRRSSQLAKGILEAQQMSNQSINIPDHIPMEPTKDKSEKRARELHHRADGHFREKRPKQSLRSKTQEVKLTLRDLEKIDSLMNSPDLKSRRCNVEELKEKFELCSNDKLPLVPEKTPRNTGTKQARKSRIKRRHTVGGMKDLARVAWMRLLEAQQKSQGQLQVPSWDQIQLFIENVNESRKLAGQDQAFIAREKLSTPSDVETLLALLLRPQVSSSDGGHLHPVQETNV